MSQQNEERTIILRTYNTVWKIDRKIYSIEGLKLLFPISINEILYLGVSILISYLLIKFIPFYNKLHFVIKYVVVPFGLMKFLTKQKLDGKLPHKFFYDYIMYKIQPKKYDRFKPIDETIKNIEFGSNITFRKNIYINETEELIKNNKRKGKKNNV